MARRKLHEEQPHDEGDTRTPQERFEALASQVLRVSKTEIDAREAKWKRDKDSS